MWFYVVFKFEVYLKFKFKLEKLNKNFYVYIIFFIMVEEHGDFKYE